MHYMKNGKSPEVPPAPDRNAPATIRAKSSLTKPSSSLHLSDLATILVMAAMLVLVLWARTWGPRFAARRALYQDVVDWLGLHALPVEVVAIPENLDLFSDITFAKARLDAQHPLLSPILELPVVTMKTEAPAGRVLEVLTARRPDYVLTPNSLVWDQVRVSPWFQEHYKTVYRTSSAYDSIAPLLLYRYTPSPFDAGKPVPLNVAFVDADGHSLRLQAYQLSSQYVYPQEPLYVTLVWTPGITNVVAPLTLRLQLVEANTLQLVSDRAIPTVLAQLEDTTLGDVSAHLWTMGEQVSTRYTLVPPAGIPQTAYRLLLSLAYTTSGQPLWTENAANIFPTLSYPPNVTRDPPQPEVTMQTALGDAIALVGYDAPTRMAPGDRVRVAFYWHVLDTIPGDYKVFVHLLGTDADGERVLAQDDSKPVYWSYPTNLWQPGEYVRDEHFLVLDPALPRGDFQLVVGMYDAESGERLPAYDAGGHPLDAQRVTLSVVRVR